MRIGFGEAGAKVIAKNLAGEGSSLNLMGGGEMIHSIFGFCDVRQFTDTTECLQEEVMLFVNRIAHILHGIVVQCSGAANKNIGDAFLLTWKLDSSLSPEEVSNIADQALLCFCKTMVELGRGQEFICNFTVAATARLYKRFPGYKVRIGSGLHVGWAIEGAIGSNSKIDASYLSPNVNRTEFLESSTKEYGVALLLSEPFWKLLSPAASRYCRQVDRVRLSEKEEAFGMFTYDMDLTLDFWDLPVMNKAVRSAANILKNKMLVRRASQDATEMGAQVRKELNTSDSAERIQINTDVGGGTSKNIELTTNTNRKRADIPGNDSENPTVSKAKIDHLAVPVINISPYNQRVWEEDNEVVQLRNKISESFRALWKEGVANYIKGDWPKARDIFHETLKLSGGEDGPSKHLIAVIDENNGRAPDGWEGYRWEGGGH
jgi:class 3 adenylate cyclase